MVRWCATSWAVPATTSEKCVHGLCLRCSLHTNRQMAHGLQMAEIAQYKKRKAETQRQEQLAKKKNWGNVMHYKKMYNITVGVTCPLTLIVGDFIFELELSQFVTVACVKGVPESRWVIAGRHSLVHATFLRWFTMGDSSVKATIRYKSIATFVRGSSSVG